MSQGSLTSHRNHSPGVSERAARSILLLSVSHNSAPVAVRERLAFDHETRVALLRELAGYASEAVIIGTCNRTEIYLTTGDPDETLLATLPSIAHLAGTEPSELAPYIRVERGQDAVRHLMRVAAGVDSAILGEPQILGQVRASLAEARQAATAGPELTRLFQSAIAAGKRARTETRISQGAGSISHAAVELARDALGTLDQCSALAIGLGEMGQLVARNLRAHGVSDLLLCNRTDERAATVAREIGARAVPWHDLDHALGSVDIVVSATGAPDQVISRQRLASARAGRNGTPLLIIDIAVPRDVDPAAGSLPRVRLCDIDSLHAVRSSNLRDRESEIPQVEEIIDHEADGYREWKAGHDLSQVIDQLYAHAGAVEQRELTLALRRLGHLSARDQEIVRILARRLTRTLLHAPVTRLKAESTPRDAATTLQRLFGLPAESDES